MIDSSDSDWEMETARPDERVLTGIGVAPGIAIGSVHRYPVDPPDIARAHIDPDETDAELDLLSDALSRTEEELSKVRSVAQHRLGDESEAIFEAQEMMVRDDEVLASVRRRIREEHESAAQALSVVLKEYRNRLETSEDEYLRQRASDLEEVQMHLLKSLQRGKAAATIQPNSIIVAERLTAADVIRFSRSGMLGFVTVRGGETSHVSIIARALNIPAVAGAEDIVDVVSDHDHVILDGRRGHLILHPTADTLERYRKRRARRRSVVEEHTGASSGPVVTLDGRPITVRVNVDFGETLDVVNRYGAAGIGLMRTEVLFLEGGDTSLGESRQMDVYKKAARATGEYGATIRLLDLGGDKLMPFGPPEANPFLGWRGIRVLLDRPEETLRPQLRALLRANVAGTLRVLLPMVSHLDEVHRVQQLLGEEADRLSENGVEYDPALPVGVMVEVPAVGVQAKLFAEAADFLSIGTNDLTQYVLAVDRGNDQVANRYDALHPAVLALIKRTVEAGQATGTPVAICGELASDIYAVPILLGLGLDTLSVSPPSLPMVKHIVTHLSATEAQSLAANVLDASDAGTVRRRARTWCDEHLDSDVFGGPDDR